MAEANTTLVTVLRSTADRIENGANYRWTHQGRCNCGQLVQTVTGLGAAEIHRRALQKLGEWTEHANDYCPFSSHPMDQVIHVLREIGFDTRDLAHIEYLSDPRVLAEIRNQSNRQALNHKSKDDVVLYFRTWAQLLENELPREDSEPFYIDVSSRNTKMPIPAA
ncbi:MAG: hypothetical protein AAF649_13230 [Verrucomicrobiota bacterium]